MKLRLTSLVLALTLVCAFVVAPFTASAAPKDRNALVSAIPVEGTLPGGTFEGTLKITEFGYDQTTGLWVDGVLKGTAVVGGVSTAIQQAFEKVDVNLPETASSAAAGNSIKATCDILFLDIGAISLDLLGLTVDLSQIVLDINAVSGAGNLLGNLLCAVVGLLDPNGLLDNLLGNLTTLLNLLTRINNLLG